MAITLSIVHPISETAAHEARELLRSYQTLLAGDHARLVLANRSDDAQLFRDEIARVDRSLAALTPR